MRTLGLVLFLTSIVCAQAQNQPVLEPRGPDFKASPQCPGHQTFQSHALGRSMSYCVILPGDYGSSGRRYPVLYLLHGLWGSENDWLALTKVSEYARNIPLVIVMPEGDDGWYTNWQSDPTARYEDYLFTDLPREIAVKYRVIDKRDSTFIAGLSMGGYGALKAALKHPDRYATVGAFSSAFGPVHSGSGRKTIDLAFGPAPSPTRDQNDDYLLAARAKANALPYLVLTCGTTDPLLDDNRKMIDVLNLIRARYEYHEMPGSHAWPFWDASIKLFLDRIGPQLRDGGVEPTATFSGTPKSDTREQ